MAVVRTTYVVCDVCKKPTEDKLWSYQVTEGTRKAKVDLCDAHRQPLEGMFGAAEKVMKVGGRKPAAKTTRAPRVSSLADIEKAKAKKKS